MCVGEENIRRLVSVQPSTVYVILIQLIQAFLFDFIVYIHNCTPETIHEYSSCVTTSIC